MPYKDYNDTLRTVRKNSNDRRNAVRAFIDRLKDAPCQDCGNRFPPECMDYDHRPGEVKSWCVGRAVWDNTPVQEIAEEIRKCDLVCANCHRIRTRTRRANMAKAQGKQEISKGSDCGGHAAYQKAAGPASSKQGSQEKTPYRHR